MYAVIKTGGKQYLVKEGDDLKVEKLSGAVGEDVSFEEVLLIASQDGNEIQLGAPFLSGTSVKAIIVEQGRAKKVTVVKFKPKVRYRRKRGHRQEYTKVRITAIS
ncbi:50S ribosomal protein L21 [Candidatus Uhrbacteria bacterium]|nr:50S ribosomal protein L21 [Candidatus Uhrbacteria bacterium]